MNQIGNLLQQYTGGASNAPPASVHQDYDSVVRAAPQQDLGQAITGMFRSDQTPPFGQLVGNLFGRSNDQQKAGLLTQLLSGLGPGAVAALPGGLGNLLGGGGQVTPEAARNVSPEAVQQIAEHAEKQNPSVVDNVGSFYSQHPTLVKELGALAMVTVLGHMAMRR